MTTTIKTASVLAFERKLDPSDALFFAGRYEHRNEPTNWHPIIVREKSVRGTISNRLKAKDQDPVKLDAAIQKPNLQTVDVATLGPETDALRVQFSLRVLPGVGSPSACNSAEYQKKIISVVNGYIDSKGIEEIAKRYAHNLANGRFLWRNRIGAEEIEINVSHEPENAGVQTWTFKALDLSLRNFYAPDETTDSLKSLTELISKALATKHALMNVNRVCAYGARTGGFPIARTHS